MNWEFSLRGPGGLVIGTRMEPGDWGKGRAGWHLVPLEGEEER